MSEPESSPLPAAPSRKQRLALAAVALVILVAAFLAFFLGRTPQLQVSEPTALRVLPAPDSASRYVGVQRVAELRRILAREPWRGAVPRTLLERFVDRGILPERWPKGRGLRIAKTADEAGALTSDGGTVLVARLGYFGRAAFNLFRWTVELRGVGSRERYGQTPGVKLLSGPDTVPIAHAAMRGSYLFVSPTGPSLVAALQVAEGGSTRSLASLLSPHPKELASSHVLALFTRPEEGPRILSARLDAGGLRTELHYALGEELPVLALEELLAPARAFPKDAGFYLSMVWPPSVLGSFSREGLALRQHTWAWLEEHVPGVDSLPSDLGRPVSLAASDWLDVPGQLPLPKVALLAPTDAPPRTLATLDAVFTATLSQRFVRTPSPEGMIRVSFRNEARLGPLSPSLAVEANRVFAATDVQYLEQTLRASQGLQPCLADRPELASLADRFGKAPAAGLFFASGPVLARMVSELILRIAVHLPPSANADARDLFAPLAQSLDRFEVYGRLTRDGDRGRVEMRLELSRATQQEP